MIFFDLTQKIFLIKWRRKFQLFQFQLFFCGVVRGGYRGRIMLRPYTPTWLLTTWLLNHHSALITHNSRRVPTWKVVRMNFLVFFLAYIKYGRYICGDLTRCLKKAEESIIFIFISYGIHSSWEECIFFIACWCLFAFEFLFLLLSLHWKNTFC